MKPQSTDLFYAINANAPDRVSRLIKAGADVNVRDDDGRTPLHVAASFKIGDIKIKIVETLIASGAEIDAHIGTDGKTPLYKAAEADNPDIARVLIDAGADVNARDSYGRTPLYASALGKGKTVQPLIDARADVNARDGDNLTPLHYAAGFGTRKTVQALIDAGADINAKDEYDRTPLHEAMYLSRLETAEALVDAGADVNARDKDGDTPLHKIGKEAAAQRKITRAVQLNTKLFNAIAADAPARVARHIKDGADVNARDILDRTPLHRAAYKRVGNAEIIKTLIDAGAEIDSREGRNGRTPLHMAAYENNPNFTKVLTDAGADINAKDKDGDTPLHYAAKFGTEDTVGVLIAAGADVNARGDGDRTPLHKAARYGGSEMVQMLINAGANVNVKDISIGFTPLHMAMRYDNPEIAGALVVAGADANARDNDGKTPLHYAAGYISKAHNHGEIINTLIEAGADVNVMDNGGKTPRHYATERGKDAIIKILSEAENRNAKVLEQALREGTSMQKEDQRMYGAIVQETRTGRYGFLSTDHPLSYGSPVFVPLDDTYRPTGEPPKGSSDVGNLISCGYVGQLPLRGGKHEGWTPEFADAVLKAGYRFDPEYRLDSMDGAAKATTDSIDKDANHNAKTLEQTLKEGVRADGSTVYLDPLQYTVVRADKSQGLGWIQDLKEYGLKPAAAVAEKEGTAMVLKHGTRTLERQALIERLEVNRPNLTVSQGGKVKPAMVLEAAGASIDMQKFMHTMIRDYTPAKGKGMER